MEMNNFNEKRGNFGYENKALMRNNHHIPRVEESHHDEKDDFSCGGEGKSFLRRITLHGFKYLVEPSSYAIRK